MSWDDGKHTKVKRVDLTYDDVIRSIEVEYHGTANRSQRRGPVGDKSAGITLRTDEYITGVDGYYKTTFSGDVITALTFKTNLETYGPYGNKTRQQFSAYAPKDSQIAGFLGTSGDALSSIDVHFAPIPPAGSIQPTPGGDGSNPGGDGTKPGGDGSKPSGDGSKPGSDGSKPSGDGSKPGGDGTNPGGGGTNPGGDGTKPGGDGSKPAVPGKIGPLGGEKGDAFDDDGFEGVKKITVAVDEFSVTYIKIEYVKDGKIVTREHGTARGALKEFSVDYPNDNITAIGGTYDRIYNYDTTLVTSLNFTLSSGKKSPRFGRKAGTDFILKGENGGKLLGFHGRGGYAIDAIGAYFDASSKSDVPLNPSDDTKPPGSGKMGPLGGEKGDTFDDSGFEGVKKITVGADEYSISYIKIEYVKDGKIETREHGTARGQLKEFPVDYPNEYITAVGGSYNHIYNYDTTLITSLYFTLSNGKASPKFGKKAGTDFNLKAEKGGQLLGFHGRGGYAIDAIGAYFDTTSSKSVVPGSDVPAKKGPLGGDKGDAFDDSGFEGVKKITVGADEFSISYIKIEYVKDGKVEILEHGTVRGQLKEFPVDYPKENIIAVGGSYNHIFNYDTTLVTSLTFTLSSGKNSPRFGRKAGTDFILKGENEGKLLGFHGRGGYAIDAIGAYFDTASSKSVVPGTDAPAKKGPLGGDKGDAFDDDGFEGVKKITVGADEYSVTYIKIEYVKDGKEQIREHGTVRGQLKEFLVDYPKENITAVGGSYNHIFNYDTTLVTSLNFTLSSGKTSPRFGRKAGTDFILKGENGGKLLGFHGRGGYAIDAIGAYFDTSSKSVVPGDDSNSGSGSKTQKVDPQGGEGGNKWDDGADHDGVTKIDVAPGRHGIEYIKFDYVKKRETKEGPVHGGQASGFPSTIVIGHPDEYLVSVEGWFDSSNIIQAIQFTTNKKTSDYVGFSGDGTQFTLEVKDKKIIGFHGFAGSYLNSLGAYFAPI